MLLSTTEDTRDNTCQGQNACAKAHSQGNAEPAVLPVKLGADNKGEGKHIHEALEAAVTERPDWHAAVMPGFFQAKAFRRLLTLDHKMFPNA